MNKNQTGFALIEGLLMILILAIIAFGGYYVWHSQKQANTSLTQANQVSQNTKTTSTSSTNYFTISAWKVRAPYSGSLTLKYDLFSNESFASVYSSELVAADPLCVDYGGHIERLKPGDAMDGTIGGTAAQYSASLDKQPYAKQYAFVGGYYYFFFHDQAVCSQDSKATDLQGQTSDAVRALVPKLQTY